MKLTNYYRGYVDGFDCVIHGTIKMTVSEWSKVEKQLLEAVKTYSGDFYLDILKKDIERKKPTKNGFLVNVRVPLTEWLVKQYKLDKYKRGNYQIMVTA